MGPSEPEEHQPYDDSTADRGSITRRNGSFTSHGVSAAQRTATEALQTENRLSRDERSSAPVPVKPVGHLSEHGLEHAEDPFADGSGSNPAETDVHDPSHLPDGPILSNKSSLPRSVDYNVQAARLSKLGQGASIVGSPEDARSGMRRVWKETPA